MEFGSISQFPGDLRRRVVALSCAFDDRLPFMLCNVHLRPILGKKQYEKQLLMSAHVLIQPTRAKKIPLT